MRVPFVANMGVFALKSWPRKMKPLPFSPRALSSCASCPFPLPGGLLVTAKAVASGRKNTQNPSRATAAAAATRVAVGSGHLCAGTCSVAGMRGRSCTPRTPMIRRGNGPEALRGWSSAQARLQMPNFPKVDRVSVPPVWTLAPRVPISFRAAVVPRGACGPARAARKRNVTDTA